MYLSETCCVRLHYTHNLTFTLSKCSTTVPQKSINEWILSFLKDTDKCSNGKWVDKHSKGSLKKKKSGLFLGKQVLLDHYKHKHTSGPCSLNIPSLSVLMECADTVVSSWQKDGAPLIFIDFDFVDIMVLAFPFFAVVVKCVVSKLELLHKVGLWPSLNLWHKDKETTEVSFKSVPTSVCLIP